MKDFRVIIGQKISTKFLRDIEKKIQFVFSNLERVLHGECVQKVRISAVHRVAQD